MILNYIIFEIDIMSSGNAEMEVKILHSSFQHCTYLGSIFGNCFSSPFLFHDEDNKIIALVYCPKYFHDKSENCDLHKEISIKIAEGCSGTWLKTRDGKIFSSLHTERLNCFQGKHVDSEKYIEYLKFLQGSTFSIFNENGIPEDVCEEIRDISIFNKRENRNFKDYNIFGQSFDDSEKAIDFCQRYNLSGLNISPDYHDEEKYSDNLKLFRERSNYFNVELKSSDLYDEYQVYLEGEFVVTENGERRLHFWKYFDGELKTVKFREASIDAMFWHFCILIMEISNENSADTLREIISCFKMNLDSRRLNTMKFSIAAVHKVGGLSVNKRIKKIIFDEPPE